LRSSSSSSSRTLLLAALLLVTGIIGCGGSGDGGAVASDVSDDGERDRVAAAFADVRTSVEDRAPARICAGLGARARDQLNHLGHGENGCAKGVEMMLAGLARQAGGTGMQSSSISDVDVKLSAVAKIDVGGRTIKLPFVAEDGEWKLDSFYGISPRPSVVIP
jgi:hypothetical protein